MSRAIPQPDTTTKIIFADVSADLRAVAACEVGVKDKLETVCQALLAGIVEVLAPSVETANNTIRLKGRKIRFVNEVLTEHGPNIYQVQLFQTPPKPKGTSFVNDDRFGLAFHVEPDTGKIGFRIFNSDGFVGSDHYETWSIAGEENSQAVRSYEKVKAGIVATLSEAAAGVSPVKALIEHAKDAYGTKTALRHKDLRYS